MSLLECKHAPKYETGFRSTNAANQTANESGLIMVEVAQDCMSTHYHHDSSIPIVPWTRADIGQRERVRICHLAKRLLDAEPALNASDAFGADVRSGLSDAPRILISDQSEIPLLGNAEEAPYGYRIALLAGDGDALVLAQDRCQAFENYLENLLGISALDVIEVGTPVLHERTSLPLRCLSSPGIINHLGDRAREANGLCLVPHIITGHIWRLASTLAAQSNTHITVCGPPPRLSLRANDKLWFAARVRDVVGRSSIPATFSAYGPAALAGHVRHLAQSYERVVVKVPDSAGSAGNLPIESASLTGLSLSQLRNRLVGLLKALGWRDRYPVLIEVWDTDVVSSPSVQLWIPDSAEGLPIIEGVFEQAIAGEEGNFVGASRAQLPSDLTTRLVDESTKLAFLLQQLGYFGRCSFDAVIVNGNGTEVHWIECNGRWGGVSLPMTLSNRIIPDPTSRELVIVQRDAPTMPPTGFAHVLERLAGRLYRPGHSREGVIPLTPAGFELGQSIHFMAIAPTLPRAKEIALETAEGFTGG